MLCNISKSQRAIASSIIANELSNYCNSLVIASNGTAIDIRKESTVILTDENSLESKLQGEPEAYR